jgi:outer membrane protein assembly factor BamB
MPFWGPKHSQFSAPIEYGQVVQGAIAAFKMETKAGPDKKTSRVQLTPAWISRNMNQADPAIVANGVVFGYGSGEEAAQSSADIGLSFNTADNRIARSTHAVLYALDARTGKELWSSGDQIASFNHFTSLSMANGRVYIGTFDGMLYAFGIDRNAGTK